MSTPVRLSIGLPVYNGENYLQRAIDSILSQDFDGLELIIGDNGSTDCTEEICRNTVSADARVRYDRSPQNRGATWNYNRLVAMARGEFFKWAAHDDVVAPGFLSVCVEELQRSPTAVLAYPRTVLIGPDDEVLDDRFVDGLDLRSTDPVERFSSYMVHSGELHAVFGVIKRPALQRTRLIANCSGGDQVLLAELLLQGGFREVPERMFLRRYHPETSFVANRTPQEVALWYDPRSRAQRPLPRTRLTGEMFKVVALADVDTHTRVSLWWAIMSRWIPHHWRVVAGELKSLARQGFRRLLSRRE
ncbi:MAG: glycosyltransferase family 2 protein [Microthrixaceae bacterium]